jgi:hypothetical protein
MAADAAEYDIRLDHETAASWRTTCSLLHCPSCAESQSTNRKSDILMQDTNQSSAGCGPRSCFPCLRNLQCSNCFGKWSICIDCANVRKPFVTRHQVRRHNARKHFLIPSTTDKPPNESNKRPRDEESMTTPTTIDAANENCADAGTVEDTDFVMDESVGYDDETSDHDNLAPKAGVVVHEAAAEAVTFSFAGDRNTNYFTDDHRGLGVAYLVSKPQFGMDFLMDKLLQEDLSFQLHLASLISGMSRGQQKKFAVVMSKYHRVSAMKVRRLRRNCWRHLAATHCLASMGCPTMIIRVVLP